MLVYVARERDGVYALPTRSSVVVRTLTYDVEAEVSVERLCRISFSHFEKKAFRASLAG